MIRIRPSCLRRRFFPAAFAGATVAAATIFRPAAHRFLCAAAMRRRRGGPCDAPGRHVESERDRFFQALRPRDEHPDAAPGTPPRRSRFRTGCARRCPVASTTASMRSRRGAESPWQATTVIGTEFSRLAGQAAGFPPLFRRDRCLRQRWRRPVPPCALPAAGRLTSAFARPAAFRGATAGFDFLAALVAPIRLRPGLAAAGIAFSGAADFPAVLAFLTAVHRSFVAAMILVRPSGIRRRFFLAALAFRTAQRFRCAAAMRLGASSRANATVLSKPWGPVKSTLTPPRNGSRRSGFVRLRAAMAGGGNGRLDARTADGGDPFAVEYSQGQLADHDGVPEDRGFARRIP